MGALRFDVFTLDLSGLVLRQGTQEIALRPQSLRVLAYLAQRSGQLVTSAELIENCWDKPKQTNVNSVAQCITDIRAALGKTRQPIIRTVPREGYVFAAPAFSAASTVDATETSPARSDPPPPAGAHPLRLLGFVRQWRYAMAAVVLVALLLGGGWGLRGWLHSERHAKLTMMAVPSLAVLPFTRSAREGEERSGDAELADEITTQLRRVPRGFQISVRSASVHKNLAQPKAADAAYDVRYLVTGSVRAEGDSVHLNVQFIDAKTGRQLWARPFIYRADEAGARNRTAAQIARLLTERLTATEAKRPLPAEPTADHYAIMGRAAWAGERDGRLTLAAMALFKKGLELDPNSVPALQGYARAKISAVLGHHAPEDQRLLWLEEAEKAIDGVIAQRRDSYGAYRLRGSLYRARGEWEKAVEAFKRALKINSDYAEAHGELGRVKIELGLANEAIADIEKAIALSPTDSANLSWWCLWVGQAALHVGDYQRALDRLLEAEQANRANQDLPPWLALAYAGAGQWGKARALMVEYRGKVPDFTVAAWNRENPRDNAVVAAQRERLASMLVQLGVPEGQVTTGLAR